MPARHVLFRAAGMGNRFCFNITGLSVIPKPAGGNNEGSNNNVMPFKASLYIKHVTPWLEVKTYFITLPVSFEKT